MVFPPTAVFLLLPALAFLLGICGLGTAGSSGHHAQEILHVLGRAESARAESDLEHRKRLAIAVDVVVRRE